MTFDAAQRATFAALADVLVPAAEGMPAASAVDIAGAGLDRVLRARPDLEAPLSRILAIGVVGEAMAGTTRTAGCGISSATRDRRTTLLGFESQTSTPRTPCCAESLNGDRSTDQPPPRGIDISRRSGAG
jgi:hypothetical protein